MLTDVTTVFDNAGVALHNSFGNAFAVVDGVPLLIGAGKADNGVTTFEIGGGDDALTGTAGTDHLAGSRRGRRPRRCGRGGPHGWRLGGRHLRRGPGRRRGGGASPTQAKTRCGPPTDYALGSDFENLRPPGRVGAGRHRERAGQQPDHRQRRGETRCRARRVRTKLFGGGGRDDLRAARAWTTFRWPGQRQPPRRQRQGPPAGNGGADDFVFTASPTTVAPRRSCRDRIEDFARRGPNRGCRHRRRPARSGDQAFRARSRTAASRRARSELHEVNAGLRVELERRRPRTWPTCRSCSRASMGSLNDSDFVF